MWQPPVAAIWPFASTIMLTWGVAAAIPVILHLLTRRRYDVVPWGAMAFLLAALKKHARRMRIEQLLLLAVRMLILLLLAAAMADPFWPGGGATGASASGRARTHVVLVIDGSYSMDYRRGDATCFELAKRLASEMVERSIQGDGFTLVLMGEPPRTVIGDPAFDPSEVRDEIAGLALPHAGADLAASLAQAESIVAAARDKHPRLNSVKVCFFTDLGRTTWDAIDTPECRSRIARLTEVERAKLALVDLGEPGRNNLAVARLAVARSPVTVGGPTAFDAEVRSFVDRDESQRVVEFYVDGRRAHQAKVDVPARGSAVASFTFAFDAPGDHVVEARLAGQRLDVDNHRWLSVSVRESASVLLVSGKPGSTRYVALAAAPFEDGRSTVAAEVVTESAILERDLHRYDAIFLCNVARFGLDEAAVLRQYLEGGGGLIFFLGDQVDAENYNQTLAGADASRRVLPARLGQVVREGEHRLDPLLYRHELTQAFRGNPGSGLFTYATLRYVKLEPVDRSASRVALAFDGGDAAVVEERIGRGTSMLVATAASSESVDASALPPVAWTTLPLAKDFVSLVQEMIALSAGTRAEGRNLLVGQPIEGALHGAAPNAPVDVVAPDGSVERRQVAPDGAVGHWRFETTRQSGVYEARLALAEPTVQRFAVNVDIKESDLSRVDAELLPEALVHDAAADATPTAAAEAVRRTGLFRFALVGVLGLVFLESVLAWRFGGR